MPIPSDAPERSAGVERSGVTTSRKTRQRRSTPATPNSQSFTAEIARLTQARAELVAELKDLPDAAARGWMHKRRAAALAVKLRRVDMKIFAFRQFIFLFGDPI